MKMLRRQFLPTLAAPVAFPQTRPLNVFFITSDDLGLQLSCYGEKRIQTPNLDRFARSAVRFKTAYVAQASCSPSRSAMFTGLFPHSTGQYGLVNGGFQLHEQLRNATIPNVLKKAGYRTGIIGKLHVAPESSFDFDLKDTDSGSTRRVRETAAKVDGFLKTERWKPFFLMLNFSDPHAFREAPGSSEWFFPPDVDGIPEKPLQPSAKTIFSFQQIDTPQQRERTANYLNAVLRLDHGIGLVMESLRAAGLEENTVVIFCGDHGPPFARGKTTCYEAGLRVPFLVRWPGVSRPGTSDAMVSTTDIAPTIFDAAGVTPPATHGRSLRPVLSDFKAPWREYLAAEFHFHGAQVFYPRRAIRDSRYKLIHNIRAGSAKPTTGIDGDKAYAISREPRFENTPVGRAFDTFADPPEFELYDLQRDPGEFNNLSLDQAAKPILQRLTAALLEWRRSTRDPFLEPDMISRYASYKPPKT
jgi:N-sulfoglucosamine sulfohydrolase